MRRSAGSWPRCPARGDEISGSEISELGNSRIREFLAWGKSRDEIFCAFLATDHLRSESRWLLEARDVIATYGTDAGIDRSIALWPKLDRFLTENARDGIAGSYAALGGILAEVPEAG